MDKKFSMSEAIELILDFKKTINGCLKEELEGSKELRKFVEAGYACLDEEKPDIYRVNEIGEEVLHDYIREISTDFILFMKENNLVCSTEDAANWFIKKYQLNDEELGKEICSYICGNLDKYGYKFEFRYSSVKGSSYVIKKID